MHSIRQRLEVDRSGADLPDTQGTHFSSNNDHQRPSGARKQQAIASGRICHKVHENPQESKDITRHVPDISRLIQVILKEMESNQNNQM